MYVQQTFDTRYAAALALRSFASTVGEKELAEPFVPITLAIYDALLDDDEEVRDVAAQAAASMTGKATFPVAAADTMAPWMAGRFCRVPHFRAQVASRMVGHVVGVAAPTEAALSWTPAAAQLEVAMRFDDALFAVEDPNLFVDEVREAERWARVLAALPRIDPDESVAALEAWTADGLRTLVRLAEQRGDGPLGWTAKADVFAVCSRVLRSAVALAGLSRDSSPTMVDLLLRFRTAGEATGVHGTLLSMADHHT